MKYIIEFKKFIGHLLNNKKLIFTLIKNDFKKQYLGSYLGLFWAFAQPLVFILVIWFVFDVGFRSAPISNGTPYFLWLITGIIPWFFFADGITNGTNSIVSNDFLVKKVSFRVSILPLVQIGSALIIHLSLLVFLIISFLLYGYTPSIYWLQLPFYLICLVFLMLGLTWLTASIRVFVKDIGNIIGVIIQVGFWATPIFWNITMLPDKYQILVKLNPVTYIVNGYRDTFINHIWFWEHTSYSLYFFIVTLIIFVSGAVVFRKLRPHFGDVL